MRDFFALLRWEIKLQARHTTEWAALLMFFVIVVILMPFALGPEPDILRRLAPGLIWVAALLMSLLSLDRLLVQDSRDGTLDLMLTSPLPLEMIIFAKMAGQTLAMFAVLTVMVLPASLLLGLEARMLPVLITTFALGVPILALLGGIASAITVALTRNPAMLTLLLAPFYIPVLIFALSACDAVAAGVSAAQPLLFMGAIECLLLPSAPFIIAASLRQGRG